MPHDNVLDPFQADDAQAPSERIKKRLARVSDLVEFVMEPLSAQIEQARLEILEKIQEVNESTTLIAGQMRRQIDD